MLSRLASVFLIITYMSLYELKKRQLDQSYTNGNKKRKLDRVGAKGGAWTFLQHFLSLLLKSVKADSKPNLDTYPWIRRKKIFSLYRVFPESLRWLLATQHYHRAKRQMYAIARSNKVDTATDPNGILSGEDWSLTRIRRDLKYRKVNISPSKYDYTTTNHDKFRLCPELERELQQKPRTSCITQLRSTRNLWKSTVVLCVNSWV